MSVIVRRLGCQVGCHLWFEVWSLRHEGRAPVEVYRLCPIEVGVYAWGVRWDVRLLDEVETWLLGLDDRSYDLVAAAIEKLKASRHHNMKELRPGSAGSTEVRILFVFDPQRRAVLLVGGDKSGDWRGWYVRNIKVADDRYDGWLRGEYRNGT
jgi:hypothetical protein